jgi:predicted porin
MKKSLFAIAAVTAFSGAAQAQSSVTVYGIYDGGYDNRNMTEKTIAGVKSSTQQSALSGGESASSRIGFRGVEDLGKGLSANFNLELGITAGTGEIGTSTSSNLADTTGATQGSDTGVRTAIVGLADKQFGSIAIGRQLTGMHGIVAGDVWGGNNVVGDITYSDFRSTAAGAGATANGRASFVVTRSSNMATYISPSLMGLSARVDWGNTTATGNATTGALPNYAGTQYGIKGAYLTYTNGPITAKVGTVTAQSNAAQVVTTAFTGTKTQVNAANLMYKAKGLTVQGTYAINKTESLVGVQESRVRANKLSASYQMGAFMPFVQYGQGGTEGGRVITAANTATDDKGYQAGVEYGLSKRTNLYAAYGSQERSLKSNSSASTEVKEMAIGVRHTF